MNATDSPVFWVALIAGLRSPALSYPQVCDVRFRSAVSMRNY